MWTDAACYSRNVDLLAIGVRASHAVYVAFLITGPALMWSGALLGERRLTHPAIGRLHLAGLAFAGLQQAAGWPCPLTWLEQRLSAAAPDTFVVPMAWTDPTRVPAWTWLVLAIAAGVSLWTCRAVGDAHARSEACA